jgi:hypothetical protein
VGSDGSPAASISGCSERKARLAGPPPLLAIAGRAPQAGVVWVGRAMLRRRRLPWDPARRKFG